MDRAILSCAAAPALAIVALLLAGPLDPPSGPVSSTYKTLAEVEPRFAINRPSGADSSFSIEQSASCYLTGNITQVAIQRAIEVGESSTTLDFNGFAVIGGDATDKSDSRVDGNNCSGRDFDVDLDASSSTYEGALSSTDPNASFTY